MMIIDPPSPYAEREEWKKFLAEMRSIESRTPEVEEAIATAIAHLDESEDDLSDLDDIKELVEDSNGR